MMISVASRAEKADIFRNVFGKPERKRPAGRPRHEWNIILK